MTSQQASVSEPPETYIPDPCTRCIVITVTGVWVNRRFEKVSVLSLLELDRPVFMCLTLDVSISQLEPTLLVKAAW